MARPDPENVYLDLDSLILERQMPLILQDCVSRETLEKEVCELFNNTDKNTLHVMT